MKNRIRSIMYMLVAIMIIMNISGCNMPIEYQSFQIGLGAGNYVVGKDIPAGAYEIKVTSGSGEFRVNNSNKTCEKMSNEETEDIVNSLSSIIFEKDTTFKIDGNVTLKFDTLTADIQTYEMRKHLDVSPIDLNSGEYIIGVDIPEGTYKIIATGSYGTVELSNGELYKTMNSEDDGSSIKEYRNAKLSKDTKFIISDTSVQLVQVSE